MFGYKIKKQKKTSVFIVILLSFTTQILFSQDVVTLKTKSNEDNSIEINYTKDKPGTYCVDLNFTKYENTFTPQKEYIIKNSSGFLVKLNPNNKNNPVRFSYTYNYRRGMPISKVDTSFVNLLPFTNNTSVEVRYLNNLGSKYFGKEEPENWKSLLFISNKPDTICATRKGIVIEIIDKYSIDTTEVYSYSSKRNMIKIEHPDGTLANYNGINGQNIFVKEGDVVFPNQPLATLIRYDKSDTYQLRFSIYYLTKKPVKNNEKSEYAYKYIDPYFQTSAGVLKIKPNQKYTTKVTEEVIIKELSKKELKKRL